VPDSVAARGCIGVLPMMCAEDEPLPTELRLELEQLADGCALVDATEQRISRPGDQEHQREYYSGKKKQHTFKTQRVTDGEHPIRATSEAIPGKMHDKKLSDQLQTLERLPDGCEVKADGGYQGLAKQAGPPQTS
jgi:hypothetical protein